MADTHSPGQPPTSAEEGKKGVGAKDKLLKDLTAKLEESKDLEEQSQRLRKKAEEVEDSEEADKLRAEAEELEGKAKTLIKHAQRLQNGAFQGGMAGGGIGAGIAGGLGTVVGSIVGGVTAIPTTGLGILIGAGTGAIHGPWVKLVQDTVKEEEKEDGDGSGGGD
ncbi:hypothetical protein BJ170DRAFT_349789 [Xylariales sp. AK1849]|nr:hypothetical protein BJ170DRAFT_349789 [Xylariales sp. AK1849]